MLNVCPNCKQYSVKKEIAMDGTYSTCPHCGHEQPIKRMPLFVITGASESGKTTVATQLYLNESEYMVMDCDQLWVSDIFNDHEGGYRMFREVWLRLAKNMSQIGKPVVLVGCAEPKQYEVCNERRYFSDIHYLTLYCAPEVLKTRLEAKYGEGDAGYVEASLQFNNWLKENAVLTDPAMTLLDTTNLSVEEASKLVDTWILERIK